MGHLIDMFDMLYTLVLDSGQFRALVESHLTESELEYWKEITDSKNGYLTAALKAQKSYLVSVCQKKKCFFFCVIKLINFSYFRPALIPIKHIHLIHL